MTAGAGASGAWEPQRRTATISLIRHLALSGLERAMRQRSTWPRAMAFAALGAAEVLGSDPGDAAARSLLSDAADAMIGPGLGAGWPWPERRLTYANATIPEAMIAAGSLLGRPALLQRGLDLLEWLLDHETRGGHLSVTPAAAVAQATTARDSTSSPSRWPPSPTPVPAPWAVDPTRHGRTESAWQRPGSAVTTTRGTVMWDPGTGGAFDGLRADGANRNQGTESTLALLSTLQHARSVASVLQ